MPSLWYSFLLHGSTLLYIPCDALQWLCHLFFLSKESMCTARLEQAIILRTAALPGTLRLPFMLPTVLGRATNLSEPQVFLHTDVHELSWHWINEPLICAGELNKVNVDPGLMRLSVQPLSLKRTKWDHSKRSVYLAQVWEGGMK